MSRQHMIYTKPPFKITETKNSSWNQPWSLDKLSKERGGFLIEGTVENQFRHIIADSAGGRHRYIVTLVKVTSIFRREYEANGSETQINTGKTKKVSTGFLPSSYTVKQVEESGKVEIEELKKDIGTHIQGLFGKLSSDCVEVWGDEETMKSLEFRHEDPVRLKTRGSSPFIEFISKLDEKNVYISNFGGDNTTESWADKLVTKGKQENHVLPQDKMEGVAEDEWD